MNGEKQNKTRWFIATLISLLAAGGGIVALLTYFSNNSPNSNPNNDPRENQSHNKPIIKIFEASPTQIFFGGNTTLKWSVSEANRVEIKPEIGIVSIEGSRLLRPTSTVTYIITAQNEWGVSTATNKIVVLPRKKLNIGAVTASPFVMTGEKATIYVTVRDEGGNIIPGATVLIESGGGMFLENAQTSYNPQSRLHGPFSVTGLTASNGVYTAWWACNPCAGGYVMSIKASKDGYEDGNGEVTVKIK